MRTALGLGLSAAAVIGTVLTPTAGWAAVTSGPANATNAPAMANAAATASTPATAKAPATANAPAAAGGDPNTTITFAVTTGSLTMTAPAGANLGSGAPGTTISGLAGPDVVTDNRAALSATWTVTASSTDFTTGGGTPTETIPAGDATYAPGTIFTTGTVTASGTSITLSGAAQTVVTGSGSGDNTATWNPTIAVAVPASAVGGAYTGTLTQSVA
jgi:hypothetical protein